MELPLFEQVGELARTLVTTDAGPIRYRSHRRGVKLWLGAEAPPRHHFEAQLLPRRLVDATDGTALEIGFHAEDGDVTLNDEALRRIAAGEAAWRPELGDGAEAGPFLGRPDDWRRVSETWIEPDLDDPDAAFEVASRLADYVNALWPLVADR